MAAHPLVAVAVLVAVHSTTAFAQNAPAVDCANPRGLDQRRGCEMARKGVEQLRRHAEATRHIYAIYTPEYLAVALEADRLQGRAEQPAQAKLAQAPAK